MLNVYVLLSLQTTETNPLLKNQMVRGVDDGKPSDAPTGAKVLSI